MRRPSGTESRGSEPTALSAVSAVPVLALAARSGTIDLSSLSPGMVALAVGLVLSFLAPVVVASILIATDEEASNERSTAKGLSRSESPSATRTDRSIETRRESTRARTERSER